MSRLLVATNHHGLLYQGTLVDVALFDHSNPNTRTPIPRGPNHPMNSLLTPTPTARQSDAHRGDTRRE